LDLYNILLKLKLLQLMNYILQHLQDIFYMVPIIYFIHY